MPTFYLSDWHEKVFLCKWKSSFIKDCMMYLVHTLTQYSSMQILNSCFGRCDTLQCNGEEGACDIDVPLDELTIIGHLVTIGEVAQLCPRLTPQRIFMLVNSLIAAPTITSVGQLTSVSHIQLCCLWHCTSYSIWWHLGYDLATSKRKYCRNWSLQCESKKSPLGDLTFFHFFHKRLIICNQFFSHLLNVPIFARLQIFIQISPILTKLCHIKRDYPVHVICAKWPKRARQTFA